MDFTEEYKDLMAEIWKVIDGKDAALAAGALAGCLWRTYALGFAHRDEEHFAISLDELLGTCFDQAMNWRANRPETVH